MFCSVGSGTSQKESTLLQKSLMFLALLIIVFGFIWMMFMGIDLEMQRREKVECERVFREATYSLEQEVFADPATVDEFVATLDFFALAEEWHTPEKHVIEESEAIQILRQHYEEYIKKKGGDISETTGG